MIINQNESLEKYTTVKIGGIAEKFYIPESKDELIELVKSLDEYYMIGGGSNLLINDEKIFKNVIYLTKFGDEIKFLGEGNYYVGASVRLQKLINTINKYEFGGIEYLFSVPGLVGGAITMNAGRGKRFNKQISDFIISVDVLHKGKIVTLEKENCLFEYRNSIFKNNDYIILGALFKFKQIPSEELHKAKEERINLCRETQDKYGTNFGSVFSTSDYTIMKIISKLGIGKRDGISFSRKSVNWICNGGKGTFKDAMKVINYVEKIHNIFGKKIKREVIIWD